MTAVGLAQAFAIRRGEVISLVGAGGKSSLMMALSQELASGGEVVITTTTTRILDWQAPGSSLIVEKDEEKLVARLLEELHHHHRITLASERLSPEGKLAGVSPRLVDCLTGLEQVDYVIVEADGAARKPLKAPNATEPVIPRSTSLVVAVVGMDALGSRLTGESVFRPEIASRLTGLPTGGIISADVIATLITHPRGIIKGSPPLARIVPLINKVDLAKSYQEAENLAASIMEKGHPQVERVVLGQVQSSYPVVKVVTSNK
ncbi:MAG: putative selenium-dependent hydroxylase accessory protein YqeC [Dehalococcoidales bacterium]|nr:putative selenium-dependent hydroxylase accessory protein YqeC [Dehalococcoidales bacterium]